MFFIYITLLLTLFFLSRFSLVDDNNISIDPLFILYSLRMDIIVISAILVFPILFFTFNLLFISRILLSISFFILAYLEIVNFFFFKEFSTRLNYLFVEYLEYPQEVFAMIWKSYSVELSVVTPLLFFVSYQLFKQSKNILVQSVIIPKIIALPLILAILFLGIRSSVDSSTPNQSFYSYSNSTLKNDIVNNSTFSLLYAIYLKRKDIMPSYGVKEKNLIANLQKLRPHNYLNTKTLLHTQKSTFKKKESVVLVLMESFGNSFVGSLGGTPTTPYFDAMSKNGLFMSNMYSSSNRSNRGFEAVTTSLFPTYANTYLKLPKSQQNFWTIASTMKKNGYKTIFLYGGDSKFDNMKGFALSNGFDKVIDKYDFDSSIKRYTWGVADEALYTKAQEILDNTKEPIFLMMFSLSSHKPFDYPSDKIEYYKDAPIESFANSIKYADFALHNFYINLTKNSFFNKGCLAIVADHNAHISGAHKIPIQEFRIPALFLSNDITPQEIKGTTHQIDIAPTLLDIAGIDADIPAMGTNLTKNVHSCALVVHGGAYAYVKDDRFILFRKDKKGVVYNLHYEEQRYDEEFVKEGLSYIYGAYEIYDEGLYSGGF